MAKKVKLSLSNDILIWNVNRRYKINSVVEYNGKSYQNISGQNSQPDLLVDWQFTDVIAFVVDQTIINGSTNAVSGNAVYDALQEGLKGPVGNSRIPYSQAEMFPGKLFDSIMYQSESVIYVDGDMSVGMTVGDLFIKNNTPTNNILLAGGGDIPQSSLIPTIDQSIIQSSTNAVSGGAVYTGLANLIVKETTGNFSNIQTLIDANPSGTTIELKPNAVYTQNSNLTVKEGIVINGNGATLKRNPEQLTTLTASANQTSTSISVVAIPANISVGDRITIFSDDTHNTSSQPIIISAINGLVITLKTTLAHSNLPTYMWGVGTKVRKDYDQITTPYDVSDNATPTTYTIRNLTLDGNKTNNTSSFYWAVNTGIFNNGKSLIEKCTFINMPNECIMGGGMSVQNCYAQDLNGSFVHQSINVSVGEPVFGGEIAGNTTKNTNLKSSTSFTGHSEGVITFSFTSGRCSVNNNRFLGGGDAVLGNICSSSNVIDGSNKGFIFSQNYCENFNKVVDAWTYTVSGLVTAPDNIAISNNIFSNCGVDDWNPYTFSINSMGAVTFSNNLLTNGTVIYNIPSKIMTTYLVSGGTVNKLPKYNPSGQLIDSSLVDNTTSVATTKPIFKAFPTQGMIGMPVFDKVLVGGIESTNESGIELGNSFGNNNGTFLRVMVNSSSTASTPIYPMTFNPDGTTIASSTITASPATASNHVVVKSQLDAFVPSGTVNLTGNQTITGVKTFSSPVVVPDAVNANEAVNKGQLDVAGMPAHLEFSATEKTVWNNGKGNIQSNVSFGEYSLKSNSSGYANSSFGFTSLFLNTSGQGNSAFGQNSLSSNTIGNQNTAIGASSLTLSATLDYNSALGAFSLANLTNGSRNTALGYRAGYYKSGITPLSSISNSIFIGTDALAQAEGQTNQIVIGVDAIGEGSNTVTLGNTAITKTVLRGVVQMQGYTVATLPTGSIGMTAYVTNALTPVSLAAVVGGGAVVVRVFHNGTTWIVQ